MNLSSFNFTRFLFFFFRFRPRLISAAARILFKIGVAPAAATAAAAGPLAPATTPFAPSSTTPPEVDAPLASRVSPSPRSSSSLFNASASSTPTSCHLASARSRANRLACLGHANRNSLCTNEHPASCAHSK